LKAVGFIKLVEFVLTHYKLTCETNPSIIYDSSINYELSADYPTAHDQYYVAEYSTKLELCR
jgi:hypothetical protein